MLMRLFVVIALFISVAYASVDIELALKQLHNGETTLVRLPKKEGVVYEKVTFEKRSFPLFSIAGDKEHLYGLIVFSYYDKAGKKTLKLLYKENGKEKSQLFHIYLKNGEYKKEQIHVASSKVNPKSKAVKKRTAREYSEAMKLYHSVTPKLYIKEPFILPLQSTITSEFGKARVYNGSLKGYHSGTDFRAPVGTPIVASNDGVVAYVGDRFYSGGTIIIDHGEGIYSCYFHMSKYDVAKGERVQRGEVIGLSGKSGRVTGPHLHFAMRVDGVQVNPLQFIELTNKELLKEKN